MLKTFSSKAFLVKKVMKLRNTHFTLSSFFTVEKQETGICILSMAVGLLNVQNVRLVTLESTTWIDTWTPGTLKVKYCYIYKDIKSMHRYMIYSIVYDNTFMVTTH